MDERKVELAVAIDAVRAASRVCREVQRRLITAETLQKKDKSPVTVADFASQAIVCERLARELPDDPIVGEEDAAELRDDAQATLRNSVVERVQGEVPGSPGEDEVLDWIDRGGADASTDRYWTLDPIDGTKGFLRGEQYAVALGLIERGEVVLGVLGCPNLAHDGEAGALFAAVQGRDSRVLRLDASDSALGDPIRVSQISSPAEAR